MKIHLPQSQRDKNRKCLIERYGKRDIQSMGLMVYESGLQEQISTHCTKYNDTYVIMMDYDDTYFKLEFISK